MRSLTKGGGNKLVLILLSAVLVSISGCSRVSAPTGGNSSASCDVVIIGKTIAAVTAAIEASRQGAQVMVFSETECLDQRLLEEGAAATLEDVAPVEGSPQNLQHALFSSGYGSGQGWFFDLLAANSYQDLTWFSGITGLELIPEPPAKYVFKNPSAEKVHQSLCNAAASEGVQFIDQVAITGIEHNETLSFFIIRLELSGGLQKEISAQAVILADGGYLNHPVLLQAYAPFIKPAPWRQLGTGKGIQLADDLHLDLVQLNHFSYDLGMRQNDQWTEGTEAMFPARALLVVDRQIIPLNEKTREEIIAVLLERKPPEGYLVAADSQLTSFEQRHLGWTLHAGINSLIGHYEIDCPDLTRWYSRPGDYYRGTRVEVLAKYCLGGVAITGDGQALRQGKPVPGLFAAGEITGGLHGKTMFTGAALTEALVMGRKTGIEAANWAQK